MMPMPMLIQTELGLKGVMGADKPLTGLQWLNGDTSLAGPRERPESDPGDGQWCHTIPSSPCSDATQDAQEAPAPTWPGCGADSLADAADEGAGEVGRKRPDKSKPRTQLVWLHERCCKPYPEKQAFRRMLKEVANSFGSTTALLKKSTKFQKHLETTDNKCMLVTDWREVKPCMQMLSTLPAQLQPLFIAVSCDHALQYETACQWAIQVDSPTPVYVFQDLESSPEGEHVLQQLVQNVCRPSHAKTPFLKSWPTELCC